MADTVLENAQIPAATVTDIINSFANIDNTENVTNLIHKYLIKGNFFEACESESETVKDMTAARKRILQHAFSKALFILNSSISNCKVRTSELFLDITKDKVRIYKPRVAGDKVDKTIDFSDLASDEGFYANLTDHDDSIILQIETGASIRVTRSTNKGIQYTLSARHPDRITITDTSPAGRTIDSKWEDGDSATLNGIIKVYFGGFGGEGIGSTLTTSGGFPHLYSHDVSGAFIDASAVRSVASADVAELQAALEPAIALDDDVHMINVATKRALTATEFKQMFYARGDDEFSVANVYECPDVGSNILASVWGKRIESQAVGVLTPVGDDGEHFVGTSTFSIIFPAPLSRPNFKLGQAIYFHYDGAPSGNIIENKLYYIITIGNGSNGSTGTLTINEIEISESIGGPLFNPSGLLQLIAFYWNLVLPSNASRIINYNKLSGRPNDPSGVDLAYGYVTDLQRNFYASHEVMGNLEKDLCMKKEHWTICSRMSLEDQLHSLAFAAEETDDVCMSISCARRWSEVEDALAESCLAENNIIGLGDYVDLYINVRVTNGNKDTKDTIIRIRFTVQMTRGPDDLGNWNVVSSNAASAMLTTGIPYDGPEGGNLQYANAAQTEILGNMTNHQQQQAPNTTAPPNLDTHVDPHDTV